MLELLWLILASIPFVTGLTFVLMVIKQRSQKALVPERVKPDRR